MPPTGTLLVRIDTLERPSLEANCIGFGVIKMFYDNNGKQPKRNTSLDNVYLNSGRFKVPIFYGTMLTENDLSEALTNGMPHVHDAYLQVRLFNPNSQQTEVDTKLKLPPKPFIDPDATRMVKSRSVASVLFNALGFSTAKLPVMQLSRIIQDEIKMGMTMEAGEKKVLISQFVEWISNAFPTHSAKIGLINPQNILTHDTKAGTCVALDMLYNMPGNPNVFS